VICAPRASGVKKPVENSKVWCKGRTERTPSCVVMSNTDESIETMFVKFLCESMTPFGVPVVPEVKMREATDWACTRAGSSARR
jgi:hypothetical protein